MNSRSYKYEQTFARMHSLTLPVLFALKTGFVATGVHRYRRSTIEIECWIVFTRKELALTMDNQ